MIDDNTKDILKKIKNAVETTAAVGPDCLAPYKTQEIDNYTTTNVVYICKMKNDGTWLFVKIDKTGNFPTFRYANVSNNSHSPAYTYATAYTARTSLTYDLLNVLTGI